MQEQVEPPINMLRRGMFFFAKSIAIRL